MRTHTHTNGLTSCGVVDVDAYGAERSSALDCRVRLLARRRRRRRRRDSLGLHRTGSSLCRLVRAHAHIYIHMSAVRSLQRRFCQTSVWRGLCVVVAEANENLRVIEAHEHAATHPDAIAAAADHYLTISYNSLVAIGIAECRGSHKKQLVSNSDAKRLRLFHAGRI